MEGGSDTDDTTWIGELESALLIDDCDFGIVRNISKCRPLPADLRADVWQIALNVIDKGNQLGSFNGLFDLPEQALIRKECKATVDRLGNDSVEKLALVSDLEEIITFYSKTTKIPFKKDNGWTDLLQLLSVLKLPKPQLYNCFCALVKRYIPHECQQNGRPFHLFRLLLLYHDPELCSMLDTRKITPDVYALSWFSSLFSHICDIDVCLNMWDVYLQHADPFLVFFLGLVLLVNAKEQIVEMGDVDKSQIIETLRSSPSALEADDIQDFCSLAQYYASKTPQSFRRHYQSPLFGDSDKDTAAESDSLPESQALCLPVSIDELLLANELGAGDGVRYFVVDCRPAEQYNAGHLPTAFHLDANLMLQNPSEFATAIQALVDTQKQSIAEGSSAAGEHLCFMGSGREEEDQYVHMVIANFLQKKTQYVSFARGGYQALHKALEDNLQHRLTDHSRKHCMVCSPGAEGLPKGENGAAEFNFPKLTTDRLFGKLSSFSSVVKSKSSNMKEKLTSYIKNEFPPEERHLSSSDKVVKGYKNMASVFSIGDDDDDEEDEKEIVSLEAWKNKPDVRHCYQARQVKENGELAPSHLLIADTCLYVLRDVPGKRDMCIVFSRHPLKNIVKITSKKTMPELITFKFGTNDVDEGMIISETQKFVIEKAGDAVKAVKQQVVRLLDQEELSQESASAASGQD